MSSFRTSPPLVDTSTTDTANRHTSSSQHAFVRVVTGRCRDVTISLCVKFAQGMLLLLLEELLRALDVQAMGAGIIEIVALFSALPEPQLLDR